jgi:hypothetical protein
MQQEIREEIRIALWRMLDEVDGYEAFASAIAAVKAWDSSPRTWLSIVSRWTSSSDPRDVPGWALAVAQRTLVPMGARDRIAPIQARVAYEVQQAAEDSPRRAPMARVRRGASSARRPA